MGGLVLYALLTIRTLTLNNNTVLRERIDET